MSSGENSMTNMFAQLRDKQDEIHYMERRQVDNNANQTKNPQVGQKKNGHQQVSLFLKSHMVSMYVIN